jgi:serine/threonine protein kinase
MATKLADVAKWASLTWSKRHNVISGVAQGLLYIHNYSQYERCIVHRDLNPKISDFGIARMFSSSVTELHTTILIGTRYEFE